MSLEVALRHRFGDFTLEVDFGVERPCVLALFGPSGSGKSSVVNAIAGLFRPDQGRIVIGGRVVFDSAAGIFVAPRARRSGYVFQDARLFPHMRVEANLRFGWRRAARRCDEAEIARTVDLLGLAHLLRRLPRDLSGGEKSRVALGRALLASPDILLLDEPLAALDAARRAEILPWLERLRDEARVPMIYVSHAAEEVARLADEMVVLREGRVTAQGSIFDLLTADGSMGAVIETHLAAQEAGLSVLDFEGGRLRVAEIARPIGTRLRVRLRAEDIMLALREPQAISANNVLPATIVSLRPTDRGQTDVHLACGKAHLVARITSASAARLQLVPGQAVFAIVKSVIVDSSS